MDEFERTKGRVCELDKKRAASLGCSPQESGQKGTSEPLSQHREASATLSPFLLQRSLSSSLPPSTSEPKSSPHSSLLPSESHSLNTNPSVVFLSLLLPSTLLRSPASRFEDTKFPSLAPSTLFIGTVRYNLDLGVSA
ncbi:hypothetical protein BLNAU_12109 [Blattamonas nauphoetae]|uniref:Uncharacterized protein n=1 Tax=Blattamonas nauphoetae TaxID=2049346 RepID=A0ABQ9XKH8_9EUKA|nr:hypothetical protein BLNAU_12109 [Blattamonas nauphoetae]